MQTSYQQNKPQKHSMCITCLAFLVWESLGTLRRQQFQALQHITTPN